jgi:hypothetical protein
MTRNAVAIWDLVRILRFCQISQSEHSNQIHERTQGCNGLHLTGSSVMVISCCVTLSQSDEMQPQAPQAESCLFNEKQQDGFGNPARSIWNKVVISQYCPAVA